MRYQKIKTQIWHDEKFPCLSDDGKLLFFYFLTSPHSNILGAYVAPEGYILADLGWTDQRLSEPLGELLGRPLIEYDKTVNLVIILNHLFHNKLENSNQVTAAITVLDSLPASDRLIILLPTLKLLHRQSRKVSLQPLIRQLCRRLGKPEEETETEEEGRPTRKKTIQDESNDAILSCFPEDWKPNFQCVASVRKTLGGDQAWTLALVEKFVAVVEPEGNSPNRLLYAWAKNEKKKPQCKPMPEEDDKPRPKLRDAVK